GREVRGQFSAAHGDRSAGKRAGGAVLLGRVTGPRRADLLPRDGDLTAGQHQPALAGLEHDVGDLRWYGVRRDGSVAGVGRPRQRDRPSVSVARDVRRWKDRPAIGQLEITLTGLGADGSAGCKCLEGTEEKADQDERNDDTSHGGTPGGMPIDKLSF